MNKRFKRLRKQGQLEAVGLVVIVILITLGMLFMAKFSLRGQADKKIPLKMELLAQSTLSAILKTSIAENCLRSYTGPALPRLGKDILEDCARHYDTAPLGYSQYLCNGQHSCIFLRERIQSLLEQTVGAWGLRYDLNVTLIAVSGSVPLLDPPLRSGNGCSPLRQRVSSDAFPLSTETGTVESVLYLC